VAPAVLLYQWALSQLGEISPFAGRIGAGAAFLYVLCAALRLARFNVLTGVTDRRYFIGLPSPGGAGAVASMVVFFGAVRFGRVELFALACATYLLAFLMISNIRYYSFKQLDFAKRHPVGVLLVAALMVLPVATAQVVARSFRNTAILASAIGVAAVVVGLGTARHAGIPPGGTIVLVAAAGFVVASVARPAAGWERRFPQR
jgi:CDP-diacylglycerol--serine O-phosphatidyltransferase